MKIYKLYYLGVLFVIGGCRSGVQQSTLTIQDTVPVTVIQLHHRDAGNQFTATGTFTTEDETVLGFKNGGIIDRIFVKEGDKVAKGQLLASVLTAEIDAKAGQVSLSIEKATRDYQRVQRLYKDSVATLEQVQNAKTALDLARQDEHTTTFNKTYSKIIAPANGYVLAKLAHEGQVVGPGTPVLQVNGALDKPWLLKVGVSDTQWAGLKIGDAATVYTDAFPAAPLSAVVYKKAEGLDPRAGTFAVFLKLQTKEPKLAAGVFARAVIHSGSSKEEQVWHIPFEALLDGNGKEGYVFITEDGKTAKKQKVHIARIENDAVIVQQGLEHAQALLVSGSAYLVDGSPIRIQNPIKN